MLGGGGGGSHSFYPKRRKLVEVNWLRGILCRALQWGLNNGAESPKIWISSLTPPPFFFGQESLWGGSLTRAEEPCPNKGVHYSTGPSAMHGSHFFDHLPYNFLCTLLFEERTVENVYPETLISTGDILLKFTFPQMWSLDSSTIQVTKISLRLCHASLCFARLGTIQVHQRFFQAIVWWGSCFWIEKPRQS